MPVSGLLSVTLEVPSLDAGIEFYSAAGLVCKTEGAETQVFCMGQDRPSIIMIGGAKCKRLHHVALRATDLDQVAEKVSASSGKVVTAPAGFAKDGLWVEDPHGGLFHLRDCPPDPQLEQVPEFRINAPGRIGRKRRSAILPKSDYAPARPLKLGHILLFTPYVDNSVQFMTDVLGMGLADRAQDVIAFCCVRKDSDHHVVAFAKSAGVGFHHASFQVADPDEVGRAGRALADSSARGDWGFGRHTIGSNFFHYIQDPWGSWFEYYADMDFIDNHDLWSTTNYELSDSLASWGPKVPDDFVHNYEVADVFEDA